LIVGSGSLLALRVPGLVSGLVPATEVKVLLLEAVAVLARGLGVVVFSFFTKKDVMRGVDFGRPARVAAFVGDMLV
jgi:hypothetical protein